MKFSKNNNNLYSKIEENNIWNRRLLSTERIDKKKIENLLKYLEKEILPNRCLKDKNCGIDHDYTFNMHYFPSPNSILDFMENSSQNFTLIEGYELNIIFGTNVNTTLLKIFHKIINNDHRKIEHFSNLITTFEIMPSIKIIFNETELKIKTIRRNKYNLKKSEFSPIYELDNIDIWNFLIRKFPILNKWFEEKKIIQSPELEEIKNNLINAIYKNINLLENYNILLRAILNLPDQDLKHTFLFKRKDRSNHRDIIYQILKECPALFGIRCKNTKQIHYIVCDRPTFIHLDDRDRFHCENRKAIEFSDGTGHYYWHGLKIPSSLFEIPVKSITFETIINEHNMELRRFLVERSGGYAKFLEKRVDLKIDTSKYGELYRIPLTDNRSQKIVRLFNATIEKDGTRKEYWLNANPDVETAKQAVAASFGLSEEYYNPTVET